MFPDQELWDRIFSIADGFGCDWAVEHQDDDHLVSLDHKDEMELADLVQAILDTEAFKHWSKQDPEE